MTDKGKRAPRAPKQRSPHEPTAEQVREARLAAGLTQAEAGALVWFSEVAWAQWETGRRPMHPCVWWAFNQRASALRGIPEVRRVVAASAQVRSVVESEPEWREPPLRDMQPAFAPNINEYRKLLSIECPLCRRGVGVPCRNPNFDMVGDHDMGPPIDGHEHEAETISVHAARVVAAKGLK